MLFRSNAFIREGRVLALQGRVSQKEDFPNSMIVNAAEIMPPDTDTWPQGSSFAPRSQAGGLRSQDRQNEPVYRSEAKPSATENSGESSIPDLSPSAARLVLKLPGVSTEPLTRSLTALCQYWRGDTPMAIYFEGDGVLSELPPELSVETTPMFLYALVERYGINNIWIGNASEA